MKNIVVLGGGTGLPALLKGIKYIKDVNIQAIVTIADSGGSTGILSKHFDIPAVGDLRRVIGALSRERENLENTLEYRFKGTGTDLDGHSMGNLFLATHILMKNNFAEGIIAASNALNIQGEVLPVSNEYYDLIAEMDNGELVFGEDSIGHSKGKIKRIYYDKKARASKQAIKAILNADLIIFGIGSLYTSLIANLIYPGIKQALNKTKGKIVYFANIFTQHGETDDMKLSDHVKAIEDHTHKGVIDKIIVSNTQIPINVINDYENVNQSLLECDIKNVFKHDLVSINKNDLSVKHDEEKVMKCIEGII